MKTNDMNLIYKAPKMKVVSMMPRRHMMQNSNFKMESMSYSGTYDYSDDTNVDNW